MLGRVAIDGTKIKANASKHKAMSYGRMRTQEALLEQEVRALLRQAEAADQEDDQRHGGDRRGDELPAELARRESRLQKIREAKAALEAEARARAVSAGQPPDDVAPPDKTQRNFTDPEAKIQKTSDGFVQGYNAQIAVAGGPAQIIVAQHVTPAAPDVQQLMPVVTAITQGLHRKPQIVLADAGYWSEANVLALEAKDIEPIIATGRRKHAEPLPVALRGRPPQGPECERADAAQTGDRARTCPLRASEGDRGARLRADQTRARLSPVPATGAGPSATRVGPGLPEPQPPQTPWGEGPWLTTPP
jgi:DDE family transposase